MLIAKRPGWEEADDDLDFIRDVEAVGVECVDCGRWVYVTSAEYDRATESWICWTCLYGHDEDSDDEDEDTEPEEPGETFEASWRLLWLQTFPGIDEAYRHAWDEDDEAAEPAS